MPQKTSRNVSPRQEQWQAKGEETMIREYEEDIEDQFEANGGPMVGPKPRPSDGMGLEDTAAPGDDDSVSSEERGPGEVAVEASAYGEVGAPPAVMRGVEIEPVAGYNERFAETARQEAASLVGEGRLLDAWYAEFADPVTLALALQQPRLVETAAEVVIGADDRVQITNTTAFPWRCICALRITAGDGSMWIGTGWLVGPRTVITAGHCVYIHGRGGWVRQIEVVPGRNGSQRPYNSCVATSFRSVKGWTQSQKRSHDYGAIILPRDCPYGNQLGYFGYANLGSASLLGLKVNLSGYPGDKPAGTQWFHARSIDSVTDRTLVYNIDTAGGQSGAPVWRLKDGQRHAVGIHTNGSPLGNSATRIVEPVFNNIKNWKAEGS
jgi:V8-like Glu-specific endopeptidase